ncbi:hypothetical protein J5N97_012806 [Dioscorea zingiberensis]|uniref:Uncharacterized protein n=1 Tax=Dioscorea zingiberensis TaxID=325984 RepID=A0A9D5CR01_9LILI|nr:hypothetical protein J5N97_012806 [Dioscorea zingiberensis]
MGVEEVLNSEAHEASAPISITDLPPSHVGGRGVAIGGVFADCSSDFLLCVSLGHCKAWQCPMDATTSGATPPIQYHNIIDQSLSLIMPLQQTCQHVQRHCFDTNSTRGEFPLAVNPGLLLHVLTSCHLDPEDLANFEATCTIFRQPANFASDSELSISELAAFDVLGQLGNGTLEVERKPRLVRSLQDIRIIQAAVGAGRTLLISDTGQVYAFGKDAFGEVEYVADWSKMISARAWHAALLKQDGRVCTWGWGYHGCLGHGDEEFVVTPKLVEALSEIKVVYVAIGDYATFVSVYSIGCGLDGKLGYGYRTDEKTRWKSIYLGMGHHIGLSHGDEEFVVMPKVVEALNGKLGDGFKIDEKYPRSVHSIGYGLDGELRHGSNTDEKSVYFVCCDLDRKLWHSFRTDEKYPRLIEQLQALHLQPKMILAGAWHAALLGLGNHYCLGLGDEEFVVTPKVVEALSEIKVVYVTIDGKFGHGSRTDEKYPRLIDQFQALHLQPKMISTEAWDVVLLGQDGRYEMEECALEDRSSRLLGHEDEEFVVTPKVVEASCEIKVVHGARVYSISCGLDGKLWHGSRTNEMSVYSIGCGLDRELGHGSSTDEKYPRLIEHFQALHLQLKMIFSRSLAYYSFGTRWKSVHLGMGRHGSLGHGDEEFVVMPKVVEALSKIKVVYVAIGEYTLLVVV